VSNERAAAISRFDGVTGQSLGNFASGGNWYGSDFLLFTPVPEPSTLVLLCVGAVSLLACAWRRRK
jgi:hypothetical protein